MLYSDAKDFLINQIPSDNAKSILESYLEIPQKTSESLSIPNLFKCMLISAQNASLKAGVIGGSIGGIDNLGNALFSFNPTQVQQKFAIDTELLFDHIVRELNPRGNVKKTAGSIWMRYCKTILSASAFFGQFNDGSDFCEWANYLYKDKRSMSALPMILAAEIYGLGYTLACDFLKEVGFVNYGKPDVHVIEIFIGIGLCRQGTSPYDIQKIISEIASKENIPSYSVDKLFWLIGSGKFDNHPELGNGGFIGRNKDRFINEFSSNIRKVNAA